jgi:hypothetical protein
MSPENAARRRVENMSPENAARRRIENMSPEQADQVRARRRVENLGPAVIANNNAQRQLRFESFEKVSQEWDVSNPCPHCSYIFLKSVKKQHRLICCQQGKAKTDPTYPKLRPYPSNLLRQALDNLQHMSRNSSSYNNILAVGATGVDNGRNGGFENFTGMDHALKLNGRVYSFLPASNKAKGGLKYFCYDAIDQMEQHASQVLKYCLLACLIWLAADRCFIMHCFFQINTQHAEREARVRLQILRLYFDFLKANNTFVQDVIQIHTTARNLLDGYNSMEALRGHLNTISNDLQVASILADDESGNLVIRYHANGERKQELSTSENREPLCYPLLFPYGEKGWGTNIRKKFGWYQYIGSRLLMPEADEDGNIITIATCSNPPIQWPTNRWQIFSRLSQHYMVGEFSHAVDYQLEFMRRNKHMIFGEHEAPPAREANDEDYGHTGNYEGTSYLPTYFIIVALLFASASLACFTHPPGRSSRFLSG